MKRLAILALAAFLMVGVASAQAPSNRQLFWVYAGSGGSKYLLVPYLHRAITRWRAATCLDLDVSAFNPQHRVRWDTNFYGDGMSWTNDGWQTTKIKIDQEMPEANREQVLVHEIGHSLRRSGHHPCDRFSMCYPSTSINYSRITEQDLAAVCSVHPCGCFNPEPVVEGTPST